MNTDTSRIEGVSLATIAESVGTPVYVYSQAVLSARVAAMREAVARWAPAAPDDQDISSASP